MTPDFAPIAFFAFNRPEHAKRALRSLATAQLASESDLFCFVDGPRDPYEATQVHEVIKTVQATRGFRSITIVCASSNQGLFRSITSGVASVMQVADRVIVVEDDIVVAPSFLQYMNEGLRRFADEPSVGSIHGYLPNIGWKGDYFFAQGGDCWGWATWRDRWALFNPDAGELLLDVVHRIGIRKFCSSHGNTSLSHLAKRVLGRNQSWAVLWHASLVAADRITLHPGRSFVENIGNDGSGTHSKIAKPAHRVDLSTDFAGIPQFPAVASFAAQKALRRQIDSGHHQGLLGWWSRLFTWFRSRILLLLALRVARANPKGMDPHRDTPESEL